MLTLADLVSYPLLPSSSSASFLVLVRCFCLWLLRPCVLLLCSSFRITLICICSPRVAPGRGLMFHFLDFSGCPSLSFVYFPLILTFVLVLLCWGLLVFLSLLSWSGIVSLSIFLLRILLVFLFSFFVFLLRLLILLPEIDLLQFSCFVFFCCYDKNLSSLVLSVPILVLSLEGVQSVSRFLRHFD